MSEQRPKTRRFPWDVSNRWAARCVEAGYPETLGHLAYVLCLLATIGFLWLVIDLGARLISAAHGAPLSNSEHFRNVAVFFVALLSAPVVVGRAVTADRAASAARKQAETAETTNITSRINEAVKMLGAEKSVKIVDETPRYKKFRDEWVYENGRPAPACRPDGKQIIDRETYERTVPNLEVRLGALYALERIAQDSPRDHITIMETLCAYIRQNSVNLDELARPRIDILTALTILGRRGEVQLAREAVQNPPYFPDLSGAKFENNDLSALNFQGMLFVRGEFCGADLSSARMNGANLSGAKLDRVNFENTQLAGARLDWTSIENSKIKGADMSGSYLGNASLKNTDAAKAKFLGAGVQSKDHISVLNIETIQSIDMFLDGSVEFPKGVEDIHTAHRCSEKLKEDAFLSRWRDWRERRHLPWPPPGEALAYLVDHPSIRFDDPVQQHEIDDLWYLLS